MYLSHFCYHHLLPSALWRITDITKQFPVEGWKIDKTSSRVMAVMAVMALFLYKACCSYWPSRRRSWSILEAKGPLNRMTRRMTRRMTLQISHVFLQFQMTFLVFWSQIDKPRRFKPKCEIKPTISQTHGDSRVLFISMKTPVRALGGCGWFRAYAWMAVQAVHSCIHMHAFIACAGAGTQMGVCLLVTGQLSLSLSPSRSLSLLVWMFIFVLSAGDPKKFISWFTLLFNHNDNDDLPMRRTRVPQTTLLPV